MYVNIPMVGGIVLWLTGNIAWQTYNVYVDAKQRATEGMGEPGTAVVIKIGIDFFQLVGALAFIKIDPPAAVQQLFSVFALGNGVSANAMPAQCLLGWDVYGRTVFYMLLCLASVCVPTLIGLLYWLVRWLRSQAPGWKERCRQARARRREAAANGEGDAEEMAVDIRGPEEQKLLDAFIAAASDPRKERITRAEFATLVGAAAPNPAFIESKWLTLTNDGATGTTIQFEQYRVVRRALDLRKTVVVVVTATVVAVFFNFMKVSTALVEIFMPSDVINGLIYLSADWDAIAYSAQHITTMAFAGVCLALFTVGTPATALSVLVYFFRRDRLADNEIFTMFGFLYAGYKEEFFWWEAVVLFRKVAATVIALVPIGIELQALCAAGLLLVLIMLQLILRPFKDERHNVLDCLSMGSIAVKQICALAYHHVAANAVDTAESEQLVDFVSWLVTLIVMIISAALACHYVVIFVLFKVRELNDARLAARAAAQRAWITGVPEERSRVQRVWDFVRRTLARCRSDEGAADGAEDESASERRGRVALGTALDAIAQRDAKIDDTIDDHVAIVETDKTVKQAVSSDHNKLLSLKFVDGEKVDEQGWLVMEQLPLTTRGAVLAALCCCCRRCRAPKQVRFNLDTQEIAPHISDASATANVATDSFAGITGDSLSIDVVNPLEGIQLADLTSATTDAEEGGEEDGSARFDAQNELRSIRVGAVPADVITI